MINMIFGWGWILMGFFSGMIIGMKFHHEHWMGGYGSHQRRLLRLGHISFIGLGILNILFALSCKYLLLEGELIQVSSWLFIIGAISMPLCCFLLAWKRTLHLLFSVPVITLIMGVILTLIEMVKQ